MRGIWLCDERLAAGDFLSYLSLHRTRCSVHADLCYGLPLIWWLKALNIRRVTWIRALPSPSRTCTNWLHRDQSWSVMPWSGGQQGLHEVQASSRNLVCLPAEAPHARGAQSARSRPAW